jgi:hypothetical protein
VFHEETVSHLPCTRDGEARSNEDEDQDHDEFNEGHPAHLPRYVDAGLRV